MNRNESRQILKIALLPLDIAWSDVEKNLNEVEKRIEALDADTDMLILPELFSSGFVEDPEIIAGIAEESGKLTQERVMSWSRKRNIAVAGSFLCMESGKVYNRGFIATPDGKLCTYDKRHLFCLSPEARIFTSGRSLPPVVEFKSWKLSLIVCYDLRFPVWCRNKGHRYDMLIVPANWPQARAYAWRQLLIARAIENQAVVLGCNRSGTDLYGGYDNLTFAFDPLGGEVAPIEIPSDPRAIIYASYDLAHVKKMRQRLPVGADADYFEFTHLEDDENSSSNHC